MTKTVKYEHGDLFSFPINNCIIPHVTNDIGKWGSGFVIPLGNKYPLSRETYLDECPRIGETQIIKVDEINNIFVANMTAQKNLISLENPHPLDYFKLSECMDHVRKFIIEHKNDKLSIHAPRFGSERAGGDWMIIEKHIETMWLDIADVTIYIYP